MHHSTYARTLSNQIEKGESKFKNLKETRKSQYSKSSK